MAAKIQTGSLFALLLSAVAVSGADASFSRPGVTADRESRVVRVEAVATGVKDEAKTEFFVIGPNSGHAYEAISVSKAKASDIHAALEFIGLKPGRPVDMRKMQYWPRGERVNLSIEWKAKGPDGAEVAKRARAEEFVIDTRTGKPLPAEGFVFAGSTRVPRDDGGTDYAADVYDPRSIAPAFNLGASVLDVPRLATQDSVYEHQLVNPALAFPENAELTLVFEPERRDGPPRERDGAFEAAPDAGGGVRYTLRAGTGPGGGEVLASGGEDAVVEAVKKADGRHDFFLVFRCDPKLSFQAATAAARFFNQLIDHHRVRAEPPVEGQLYYRAYLPNPALKDRAQRPVQPWEMRLERKDGKLACVLVEVDEKWNPESGQSSFSFKEHPAATAADVGRILASVDNPTKSVFVFAPPDAAVGDVMAWVSAAQKACPMIFLFASP